jgi:predicted Zn-dependent peptidase
MLEYLKDLGSFNNNDLKLEYVSNEELKVNEVKEFFEKQNINQAKLNMGFRIGVNNIDNLYPAALVFNAMFGGIFQSDLIRVVREENSLAYTIASQCIFDVKLMIVSAGIDSNKYQMTKDLVLEQLRNYKEGKYTEANFLMAKDNLINELLELEDNPFGIINFHFKNKLYGNIKDVDDLISKIKAVTLDDIKEVALGVNLDTVFLLASEDYNG